MELPLADDFPPFSLCLAGGEQRAPVGAAEAVHHQQRGVGAADGVGRPLPAVQDQEAPRPPGQDSRQVGSRQDQVLKSGVLKTPLSFLPFPTQTA